MDMKIEVSQKNQLLDMLLNIPADEDFESVINKSKRKQEKRKQKLCKKKQGNLSLNSTILEKQSSTQFTSFKSRIQITSKVAFLSSTKTTLTEFKNKPTKAMKKDF
jgi:hypothetical protein